MRCAGHSKNLGTEWCAALATACPRATSTEEGSGNVVTEAAQSPASKKARFHHNEGAAIGCTHRTLSSRLYVHCMVVQCSHDLEAWRVSGPMVT